MPRAALISITYLTVQLSGRPILGAMLLTEHNLTFYQALMAAMREAIGAGRFAGFAAGFRSDYLSG